MGSLSNKVSNAAYSACGGALATACVGKIVPNASCDWQGKQNAKLSKKLVCLFAQVVLITGTTTAVAIAPQVCVPLFATYSIPCAGAATTCLQGALFAVQGIASQWLTKKANGNWTADKDKRQEHVGRFANMMELSKFIASFSTPLIESRLGLAAGLADIGYQFVYDLNPEKANRLLEPLSQRISKCYWTCVVKAFSIEVEPETFTDPKQRAQFIALPNIDPLLRKVVLFCEGKPLTEVLDNNEDPEQVGDVLSDNKDPKNVGVAESTEGFSVEDVD